MAQQAGLPPSSTALLTDHYELTMLASALHDASANRDCVFEVFARSLPEGRRFGVVAGTARVLEAITEFRFTDADLAHLESAGVVDRSTVDWLADFEFTGDIDGYPEGELYFPGSPIFTVHAPFAQAVLLETLVLSVFNHDCAVASAAARMSSAAKSRPLIEMGGRRTHEYAAVAAARAAYLAGFAATSNLEAGSRYGIPTRGTVAHAFMMLHDTEEDAFRAQVAALGTDTTLLVDTYDISVGIDTAIRVAGPELGAIRIDSGDVGVLARQAREQLDSLGARDTRIIVSGDLDEHAIAALRAEPVDAFGVGTSVVTGSGAPTANLVYKLVEVNGKPVTKRSEHKESRGGRKSAVRRLKSTGTAREEIVHPAGNPPNTGPHDQVVPTALMRGGRPVDDLSTLEDSRNRLRNRLVSLPWEGLKLSKGEPAIATVFG
ncbi:nicotinate phosphoribosyltransferase [Haloechinothrix sp. YIM 98757]|uniref:Nicotinate phosphoribosyltransferase n=1 Tax=Haloechinothrix aidingensis TaxID=2752311 RepID=A0A838A1X8_9PSEU|nr:nicotinate phosphoribosyltransferase [Haloechinothrix aidingensis]MBA0125163.1 nicotinate phosphoribosyltransferase [Haloechinothrix aidingensis]